MDKGRSYSTTQLVYLILVFVPNSSKPILFFFLFTFKG